MSSSSISFFFGSFFFLCPAVNPVEIGSERLSTSHREEGKVKVVVHARPRYEFATLPCEGPERLSNGVGARKPNAYSDGVR